MISLLSKAATLLKYVSEDISTSSSLIDLQSKLIPILASIILYCSNNIESNSGSSSSSSSSSSNNNNNYYNYIPTTSRTARFSLT